MTPSHPDQPHLEDLTPQARERAVAASDGRWALLPPGTSPVRIAGLAADEVTLVPANAYVDAALRADERGRTLALLNAYLFRLGVRDPGVRALLDAAGYDTDLARTVAAIAGEVASTPRDRG